MIAIFLLLGLGFLAGGIAAIVDGLPYLVLERGFTQVIIGTTVAVTGVVLLAISWLLVELRRIRRALDKIDTLPARGEAALQAPAGSGALPAAAGLAAAGATAAVAMAAVERAGAPDSQVGGTAAPQPDLFGSLVAARMERAEPTLGDIDLPSQVATPPEPRLAETPELGDEPAYRDDSVRSLTAQEENLPAQDELAPPVRVTSPMPPVSSDDETETEPPLGAEPEGAAMFPGPVEAVPAREEAVKASSGLDELRHSLEDRLRLLDLKTSGFEAPRPPSPDPLEAAGAWMERPAPGEPEPQDPTAAVEVEQPGWEAAVVEAGELHLVAVDVEEEPEADMHAAEPEEATVPPESEPATASAEEIDSEPPVPEASEEGVVGAYQVGDTQFTIYADGSIQARTPDGDYSFGSMDELKLFLASERNRLGV